MKTAKDVADKIEELYQYCVKNDIYWCDAMDIFTAPGNEEKETE